MSAPGDSSKSCHCFKGNLLLIPFQNVHWQCFKVYSPLIFTAYKIHDIYPTANGMWASPGDPRRFNSSDTSKVQIEKILFGTLNFDKIIDSVHRNMTFASPYFKIEGNCVVPILGASVEELFEIKKRTILKARGFSF